MTHREYFLDSLLRELTTCTHLFAKLPESAREYRPSPKQRSTHELLQYISFIGIASMRMLIEGSWDSYQAYQNRSLEMRFDEFPIAMDAQIEEMVETFNAISDEDLEHKMVSEPPGTQVPLGVGLMRLTYAWLIGYRMQLFLYAKACGVTDIGTSNNWYGVDWKPRERASATSTA